MRQHHVLLLGGSLARPSHSSALLRAAERVVAVRGASTCRWDLGVRPLQSLVPGRERAREANSLVAAASAADALVLVSPIYHGSYSGVVKDALDHLSAEQLDRKPVALLSNGGSMPSTQALDHLRLVVRALLGLAVPRQLVTVDDDFALEGERFRLASPAVELRLALVADDLLWLVERLRAAEGPAADGAPIPRRRTAVAAAAPGRAR
jgi:NAD(P)H-dependent FMN reductase